MNIQYAQREVRAVYIGGFWGQLVSSVIWLVSAALGTRVTPTRGSSPEADLWPGIISS
jgi:hypothetical protein